MLFSELKNNIINGNNIIKHNNEKHRLFYHDETGNICIFRKGSSKCGYIIPANILQNCEIVQPKKEKSQEDKTYLLIKKYRNKALKANFKNSYIDKCINLPSTIEQWKEEGSKNLYQYHITVGNSKDGEIISIESALKNVNIKDFIVDCIKNKKEYTYYYDFRGYDARITTQIKENGEFWGYLDLEYRGCANGHYYILINEKEFIYYEKD